MSAGKGEPMREAQATCGLCGEPMPAGEEMFKYHGLSGPCPKPQKPVEADGDLLARAQLLREAVTVLDEPFHRDAVACTLLEAADDLDALVEEVRTLRAQVESQRKLITKWRTGAAFVEARTEALRSTGNGTLADLMEDAASLTMKLAKELEETLLPLPSAPTEPSDGR